MTAFLTGASISYPHLPPHHDPTTEQCAIWRTHDGQCDCPIPTSSEDDES